MKPFVFEALASLVASSFYIPSLIFLAISSCSSLLIASHFGAVFFGRYSKLASVGKLSLPVACEG